MAGESNNRQPPFSPETAPLRNIAFQLNDNAFSGNERQGDDGDESITEGAGRHIRFPGGTLQQGRKTGGRSTLRIQLKCDVSVLENPSIHLFV